MSAGDKTHAEHLALLDLMAAENKRLRAQNRELVDATARLLEVVTQVEQQIDVILAESEPFGHARRARQARTELRRARAIAHRAAGLSASQIGVRMATEEKRAVPFPERTVRRWLAPKKGDATP